MNLLEQQAFNRRRTWLVVGLFVLFLSLLGYGFDRFVLAAATPVPIGAFVGLGAGAVSALAGYYGGDRAVLLSAGAVPIDQAVRQAAGDGQRLKLRQLQNVVEEMSIASGLPQPAIYVVPDPDSNAFATGRDPGHASVAVTQGLLESLDREELQGVVAHELSHVRNYDIRPMTLLAALVGAVALLADWSARILWYGGGRRRSRDRDSGSGGGLGILVMAVWLVAIVLAPLIGRLLAMAVSRRREYLADATAAELTRNPIGLANALQKIEDMVGPTKAISRGTAHLCIADPQGHRIDLREGFWADLFASHPPMARRIAALRAMAYEGRS